MNTRQKGMYTVEFAIVGAALFIILFGAIEVARALFAYNTLAEATRRGARVAAVCSQAAPDIARRVAVFGPTGTSTESPILKGLDMGDVTVQYLNAAGSPAAGGESVQYVRVSITGYEHRLLIPFVNVTLWDGETVASTTLPGESLGYAPPGEDPCT